MRNFKLKTVLVFVASLLTVSQICALSTQIFDYFFKCQFDSRFSPPAEFLRGVSYSTAMLTHSKKDVITVILGLDQGTWVGLTMRHV